MPLPTPFVVKKGSNIRERCRLVHPHPGVADGDGDMGDGDVASEIVLRRMGFCGVEFRRADLDGQATAVRHGIDAVDHEIDQVCSNSDRSRVTKGTGSSRVTISTDSGTRPFRRGKTSRTSCETSTEFDPRHLLASECGQARCQFDRPARRRDDLVGVFDLRRSTRPGIAGNELRVADDRHQHVVEVMGDPAGEASERLHLLAVSELSLRGRADPSGRSGP